MVTSLWGGLIGAQIIPPIPFNEQTGQCIPFNQSPLSLKEAYEEGVTRHDLDLDGYSNTQEFLQLSDPTDSQSTPIDRDGDGVPRGQDECDFDPTVPQDFIVSFVGDALPAEADRGEAFEVVVKVVDRQDKPVSNATVNLTVEMSGGTHKNVSMAPTDTAGEYEATLAMRLGDPANPGDPWIVSAVAERGAERGRVPAGTLTQPDQRQHVTVNPIAFPVEVDTYLCTNPSDLATCEQKSAFFQNQDITVIARPNMTQFFRTPTEDLADRSAVLRYASQVTVDGIEVAEGPEFDEPMAEVDQGGQLVYHATIDPAATHLPPPGDHDALGTFAQTEFRFTAYIEDDAGMSRTTDPLALESSLPNTGEETTTVPVDFAAPEERIFVHPSSEPTPRTHVLPIKVEYQRSGETTTGPSPTATAKIYETSTSTTPIATVTLVEGIENGEGTGVYTGGYEIQIDDPITQRPDVVAVPPDFDYKWFVDVTIVGSGVSADNAKFRVSPTTVPSEVSEPEANANFTARISDQGDLVVDPIPVEFTLTGIEGEDFHNDPAQRACAAGEATATIYHRSDSEQLVAIDEIILVDGVGVDCDDTYEGTFNWGELDQKVRAFALAGDWVLVVSFSDEANVANTARHEVPIVMSRDVVGFGSAQVVREDPSVKIRDVFGFNNPEWDPDLGQFVGITGDNATDKDPILGIDDRTQHRFIGVEGTATGLRLQILVQDGDGNTVLTIPPEPVTQPLTGVFVQFDDRELQLEVQQDLEGLVVPYYGRAILDEAPDPNGVWNWRVMFDTQGVSEELHDDEDQWEDELNANDEPLTGYDWPPMRSNEFTGVNAYAYTGPIAYEPFRHQSTNLIVTTVSADIEPIRVTPQAHVPGDATGTYSPVAKYSFDFDYQGPSKLGPVGVEIPTASGSQTVFGGGPLLYSDASDDPITLVAPWTDPNGNEVVETLMYFAKVNRRNCVGNSGSEWCEDQAYTLEDGDGAYVAMTPASNDRFKIDISGPLKQDDTADGFSDDGNDEDERFWAKLRIRNQLGYTTGPTGPAVWPVDAASSSSPGTGESFTPFHGAVPGFETTQLTFVEPDITITKVEGVAGPRPDFRTEDPFIWTFESGAHESLPSTHANRGVQAYIQGDQIKIHAKIELQQLPDGPNGQPLTVDGLTDQPQDSKQNEWDVLQRICCDSNGNLVTTSNPDPVTVSGPDANGNFLITIDVTDGSLAEQVGMSERIVDAFTEFQVEAYNSLGVKGTSEIRLMMDRNAAPGVDLLRIVMDDQDGVDHAPETIPKTSFNNTNPPVVSGIASFQFEGVDLDGQNLTGSHPDVNAAEQFQLAFSHLTIGPDAQFYANEGGDVSNPPQRVEFPVEVPEVCDPILDICAGPYEGVEMYLPLRVGMDPLFVKMDDPMNPASWQPEAGDTVFGLDTSGEGSGFVRLYHEEEGNLNVVTASDWDLLTVWALEMNLADDDEQSPYIGLHQDGWNIAIAFDRGFNANDPTTWRAHEDPRDPTPPDQWAIVACTMKNTETGENQRDVLGITALPGQSSCPLLEEYEWLGIVNAITPLTIYNEASSPALNLWGGNCRVEPWGTDYPQEGPGDRCDDNYDTEQDFEGQGQDGVFMIPRGFFWEFILNDDQFLSTDLEGGEFARTLATIAPYEDLRLPNPSAGNLFDPDDDELDDAGVDMLIPDGQYVVTGRGIDGVEVISQSDGGRNDDGPLYDFVFWVENDDDDDGYSDQLEHKLRDQIRNGTHRDFDGPGGYRGSDSALNPDGLPLAEGAVNFTHPTLGFQQVTAHASTPCDWDGDGVPNDYECQGRIDLEAAFNMNPFVFDTPMDDPNQNGIPNFMDPTQQYRFDCVDTDQDGWCNDEEDAAGSDPNSSCSVPHDTDCNRIPDDVEDGLDPVTDADGDGWDNRHEILARTNPLDACSHPGTGYIITTADPDADGWPTSSETAAGTDPLDACSHP